MDLGQRGWAWGGVEEREGARGGMGGMDRYGGHGGHVWVGHAGIWEGMGGHG